MPTFPGAHPNFDFNQYKGEEKGILHGLAHDWFLTTSGREVMVGNSTYRYFLMKPTASYREGFNLDREIVCVFSPYPNFEPRTLDVFDRVLEEYPALRTESVCRVLISGDSNIDTKIESLLKSDPEQPIVVPFSYVDLKGNEINKTVSNRFRKHFYSRDLFAFLSPLRKDLYFYGRSNLVHEIANRHLSGEHTGLFGLRKSGKTSIIYALERYLTRTDQPFLSFDCENPSFHQLRWYELLYRVVEEYHSQIGSKIRPPERTDYTELGAADAFARDFIDVYRSKKAMRVLLIFDEVERISPGSGASSHWRDGQDFVYFWQTLRAFFQRNPETLSYLLVGTNPSSIEKSSIAGHDNPIFSSIQTIFVPSFSNDTVREMVTGLAGYMGLNFDQGVISKLSDDFAGHPFLIRQMCSLLHKQAKGERPVLIEKTLYERTRKHCLHELDHYMDMVVDVLQTSYPDEYEMLRLLAIGDHAIFDQLDAVDKSLTRHLIGYGLLVRGAGGVAFGSEVVRDFLKRRHTYESIVVKQEDRRREISERRNHLEQELRVAIRRILIFAYGKQKAATSVLQSLPETRRTPLLGSEIDDLLSRTASPLFFLDLINVLGREWPHFEKTFDVEKNKLLLMLNELNSVARPDAHAKDISDDDFSQVRLYFKKIEGLLSSM